MARRKLVGHLTGLNKALTVILKFLTNAPLTNYSYISSYSKMCTKQL